MIVSTEILDKLFNDFAEFIQTIDKKPFATFANSILVDKTENYKYSVYNEARENLGNKWWKPEDIGTGKIQKAVSSAIKTRVNHSFQMIDNNLVDWRKKDSFTKIANNKNLEATLFNFYKSKISDRQAFENLIEEKLSYQFIAYLFFIKDRNLYLPISQEKFDEIFEQIGLTDFKTSHNLSWENYTTFIDIVKQVRNYLRAKDSNTTLLDAHSFLWILGNQMKSPNFISIKPLQSATARQAEIGTDQKETQAIEIIAEEDDELAFPEGKEIFRLHKSKERNKELIKEAKQKHLQTDSKLCCQVCGFSFIDKYGELGEGFIEAHHLFPISQLTEETETKISDLALVCSNCHRMLHRRRPWLTLDDLKQLCNLDQTKKNSSR